MFENIALSFKGIWNHKLRSILTMLGIIIGIAAIITIVSTIKGTNDQIKQNLIGAGNNVVTVKLGAVDGYFSPDDGMKAEGVDIITKEEQKVLNGLEGVQETSLYVSRSWTNNCFYKNTGFSGSIYGIDDKYFNVYGYRLNYGRLFTDDDYSKHRKVVIIDSKVMGALFEGANPVGQTMEIQTEPFTVIGVVAKDASAGPTINSLQDYYMYADQSAGSIFVPDQAWPILYSYDECQSVAVKAASTDQMTNAGNNVASELNSAVVNSSNYAYKADDLLQQASELQSLSNSTNNQLLWIAGISLLVGGIGVMNIMLVSVTERTSEIGLKKAVGAKRGQILGQFLTESAVLTSLGGILGVVSGLIFAHVLSAMTGTPVAISIPSIILAVAFSMVIGIVFGLIPAVKASKLNPIEALRRE